MSLLDYDGLDYHTGKFKTWVKKLLEGKSNAGHKHTKSDITDFPNLGTASSKDIASNGNASTTQVVMGNDTRLTDARKASDVSAWAKAAAKPTYTASEVGAYTKSETDTKLNSKINTSLKGSANGLAELDSNGKVPSTQLPSFVDDVIEGYLSSGKFYKESAHTTQISGESGKIYIDLSTEKTYRWSGSAFVVISETLALGETSSTAYRGDRGKTAYDHSQSTHARIDATKVEKSSTNGNIKINGTETTVYTHPSGTNPHGTTKSDVGLGNVGNFKAVSTVSNQGLSDTEKSNARSNIGAQVAGSYASSTHTHDDRYYTESEIDSKLSGKANSSHTHTKSQITDFPTSMPANGGNSTTVNGHTVNSNVPANAKFTDTTYDDTEVKESIEDLNSNLDGLKYSEIAGGKNLFDVSKIDLIDVEYRNGVYTNKTTDSMTYFFACIDYWNDDGYIRGNNDELFRAYVKGRYRITGKIIEGCTKIRFKHSGKTRDIVFFIAQISYFGLKVGDTFTISIDVDEYNPSNVGGLIVKNIQIEKGTQATEYEQYIPSVKMLTDEVKAQNESLSGKANSSHTHTKSQITDFPTSMPANGGNSTTVNGHTVNSNVPANAKFTDTTYNIATTTANGLMSKEDKTKLNGLDDIESVKSFIPLFGTTKGRGTIADALNVNLNDVNGDENKIGYVYNGGSINLPDYCGFGIREVYYYNPTNVFVKIVGWDNYYSQITSWYNIYSSDHWVGWTKHVSNTDLKTISDSLELRLPKHFISSPTTNIDEINETCLVYYNPASNGGTHPGDFPADGTGFVMSYVFDGNFIRQIAFSSWGNIFKTRQKINGTWSAWTQIIDSTGGTINGQLYAKYFRLTDNLWSMGVADDSTNMSIYPNTGSRYGLGFYAYSNPTTIIRPQVDNYLYLGHASYRFAEVHSVNMYISAGTAVTSDRRYKNTINELDEELSNNFIMSLKPSSFKYNDGESGRLHYGLIAQDVEEAMNENNISTQDFAGLVIEKLTKLVERQAVDENGEPKYKDVLDEARNPVIDKETGENVTEPVIEEYLEETGEIKYDLRYDEFIAPMIKVIQKQNNEITELKREIEELKTLIITHINGGTN